MSLTAAPKTPVTAPQFLAWAEGQTAGRYELAAGEIVAMAPERVRHNLTKAAVYRALDDAVRAAAAPCVVFTDGVAIVIDDATVREPDASVQCGLEADPDATKLDAPLIVVEVTSPSSDRDDTGAKLIEYFSVPSIRHYLIVSPERRVVVHHQKDEAGEIATRLASDGSLTLTPPGIAVAVADLFARAAGAGRAVNQAENDR